MLVRHEMGAHEEYAEFRSAAEIGARLQLPEMCPDLADARQDPPQASSVPETGDVPLPLCQLEAVVRVTDIVARL